MHTLVEAEHALRQERGAFGTTLQQELRMLDASSRGVGCQVKRLVTVVVETLPWTEILEASH